MCSTCVGPFFYGTIFTLILNIVIVIHTSVVVVVIIITVITTIMNIDLRRNITTINSVDNAWTIQLTDWNAMPQEVDPAVARHLESIGLPALEVAFPW